MRMLREETAALLVDMQERLAPAIHRGTDVLAAAARLIRGLGILEVPVVPIRQYPKGLGELTPELRAALGDHEPTDKITFSAWDTPEIRQRVLSLGRKNLLVFGMETHICVLQTIIDMASEDLTVVMVADCCGSRRPEDHDIALRRAEKEGARLTTSESVLFELSRRAGTETFKKISALVK